tara:strand:- start:3378 stop:3761 length:384 start_codon:yes stop_codon:yes gene_type:complete
MQYRIPESFIIGVEAIDAEHQTILREIGDIKQGFESGHSDNLGRSLLRVGKMLKNHFQNEEAFMKEIGFPGMEAHAAEHEELLSRVGDLDIETADIGNELIAFLDAIFQDMGKSDIYLREFLEAGEA